MLSCKIKFFFLVYKIIKKCHQDFSLLHTKMFVIHNFLDQKWFIFNMFSPNDDIVGMTIKNLKSLKDY